MKSILPEAASRAGDVESLLPVDAAFELLVADHAQAEDEVGADPLADRVDHASPKRMRLSSEPP